MSLRLRVLVSMCLGVDVSRCPLSRREIQVFELREFTLIGGLFLVTEVTVVAEGSLGCLLFSESFSFTLALRLSLNRRVKKDGVNSSSFSVKLQTRLAERLA